MARTLASTQNVIPRAGLGISIALTVSLLAAHAASATVNSTDARLFNDRDRPQSTNWSYSPRELGTLFSSETDGFVTGISFYKNRYNYGPHEGRLYDASGKSLASVTFKSETSSGWQVADFSMPVSIKADQEYTVAYKAEYGRNSYSENYFPTAGLVRSPLRVPGNAGTVRTWDSAGKAIVKKGATNHWVDVRFTPSSRTIEPRPTTTTPTPTATSPVSATRDKYQWPFAVTSAWNMPIGSGAQYLPLNMTPPTTGYGTDEEYLAFAPNAPLRNLVDRGYWWPWKSGIAVTGTKTGAQVRVPDAWVIPPPTALGYPNRSAAALQADGRAREFQYVVRPTAGSDVSMFEGLRSVMDLSGDGLTPTGQVGGHGGSGLTGIGGTLRVGELSGPSPIRHAVALTMNMRKWGTPNGGKVDQGFRWPAITADLEYARTGYATGYGTVMNTGGSPKDGLGMGSLLALPASVDLGSLKFETPQGIKLAWTYQNYGGYVVDNSGDDGKFDVHRHNVEIGVLDEFPAIDTGYTTNTPFGRDMNKVFARLAVVDNNTPTSVGGGGTPRQPLAPALTN